MKNRDFGFMYLILDGPHAGEYGGQTVEFSEVTLSTLQPDGSFKTGTYKTAWRDKTLSIALVSTDGRVGDKLAKLLGEI